MDSISFYGVPDLTMAEYILIFLTTDYTDLQISQCRPVKLVTILQHNAAEIVLVPTTKPTIAPNNVKERIGVHTSVFAGIKEMIVSRVRKSQSFLKRLVPKIK